MKLIKYMLTNDFSQSLYCWFSSHTYLLCPCVHLLTYVFLSFFPFPFTSPVFFYPLVISIFKLRFFFLFLNI